MMSRVLPIAAAGLLLACAGTAARSPASGPSAGGAEAPPHRGAELARVRCLLVAPFENASDAPLAADAATGALLAGVDPTRARLFPVPELRALFRDTPLELPEGVSPSLALELAQLLGADAALYGAVEGRSREADPDLVVTVRLVLAGEKALLWAAALPVRRWPGETTEAAVRRTLSEAAEPVLSRLGDPGRKRCFDPERTRKLRAVALAEARAPAPAPARAAPPAPAPRPAAAQPRTPRQVEWAKRLSEGGHFAVEDVTFAARTADLQRDGGLADLALALSATPQARARIEAFVDATSDPAGDARLSTAMAQVVMQRLVDLGVARDRLAGAGRGGESPLLPNFTIRGRAANRRVEVTGSR